MSNPDIQSLKKNKEVVGDYKQALQNKNTTTPINKYMSSKYRWNNQITDTICWTAHSTALAVLPASTMKTILQFNHPWLPLNAASS
jgi:limonene-1,2-epoxide hydrolase